MERRQIAGRLQTQAQITETQALRLVDEAFAMDWVPVVWRADREEQTLRGVVDFLHVLDMGRRAGVEAPALALAQHQCRTDPGHVWRAASGTVHARWCPECGAHNRGQGWGG